MNDEQIAQVQSMTQQERMSHFGHLLGLKKITWREYAHIVKEIPYVPKPDPVDASVRYISQNIASG